MTMHGYARTYLGAQKELRVHLYPLRRQQEGTQMPNQRRKMSHVEPWYHIAFSVFAAL